MYLCQFPEDNSLILTRQGFINVSSSREEISVSGYKFTRFRACFNAELLLFGGDAACGGSGCPGPVPLLANFRLQFGMFYAMYLVEKRGTLKVFLLISGGSICSVMPITYRDIGHVSRKAFNYCNNELERFLSSEEVFSVVKGNR